MIFDDIKLKLQEAAKALCTDESHSATYDKLQGALTSEHRSAYDSYDYEDYPRLRDVFGDHQKGKMVYAHEGGLYQCDYSIGDEGAELGEAMPVQMAYMPMDKQKMKESGFTDELIERSIPMRHRRQMADEDFAGKDRSFPIEKPADVKAAAASLGRAGAGNHPKDQIKSNIISIAMRKGMGKHLPKAWQKPVKESVAIEESGDLETSELTSPVELLESAVAIDGTTEIKLISPGKGSSGYYPAEVLERDGPSIFTEGTKMFWNHDTPTEEVERPEGDLSRLAAVLAENARWEPNGRKGPGLYAKARVFEGYREAVNELAPHIGVSIRASGEGVRGTVDGESMKIVKRITSRRSVDFVTTPGCGGQVLQLFEAARSRNLNQGEDGMTEAEKQELKEAKTLTSSLQVQVTRLQEGIALREGRDLVRDLVEAADIHPKQRAKIIADARSLTTLKEGAVDVEATTKAVNDRIKEAADFLAELTESGAVRGLGARKQEPAETDPAKIEADLKESFKELGLSDEVATIAAKGRA